MPIYEDITNGTLKLSQCFELNQQKSLSKRQMISKIVSEWKPIQSYLSRVCYTFQQFNPQLNSLNAIKLNKIQVGVYR